MSLYDEFFMVWFMKTDYTFVTFYLVCMLDGEILY
jgi:hypothetical protein